jgi:glutathionylspermidine synthase
VAQRLLSDKRLLSLYWTLLEGAKKIIPTEEEQKDKNIQQAGFPDGHPL